MCGFFFCSVLKMSDTEELTDEERVSSNSAKCHQSKEPEGWQSQPGLTTSGFMCVCVCPENQQILPFTTPHRAGGAHGFIIVSVLQP